MSDEQHRIEVLAEIARVAESARKTGSNDLGDWQDDMTYIEAMAKGLKAPVRATPEQGVEHG